MQSRLPIKTQFISPSHRALKMRSLAAINTDTPTQQQQQQQKKKQQQKLKQQGEETIQGERETEIRDERQTKAVLCAWVWQLSLSS